MKKSMGPKIRIFYLVPAIAIFCFVGIYPLVYSVWLSFHNVSLADPARPFRFVGLYNYGQLLFEEGALRITFGRSLYLTGIFATISLSFELLIGTSFALLFAQRGRVVNIARILVMIPMLLAPVVVGNIFKLLYAFPFGLLNFPFLVVNAIPPFWLTDWAMVGLIISNVWMWIPFSFLVVLAAIYSIPPEYFESASVAGASSWQKFRFLTLPLIKKAILVICLIRGVDLIRMFDLVLVLTEGGPATNTALLSFNAYWLGFRYLEISAGSAYAFLILVVVNFIVLGFIKFLAREVTA